MTVVAVCSLFRNNAPEIATFRAMLEAQARPGLELLFSFIEGDSTDDSWEQLQAWAAVEQRVILGRQSAGSVPDFDARVRMWARLGNAVIDQLRGRHFDHLVWCESDLVLPPDLLMRLVADERDVVAPAIFLGGMFYDTWGFRGLDGSKFSNTPPYHAQWHPHGVVELASVGSAVMMRRAVVDAGVRFRGTYEDGLLVGFCADARRLGFRVWMDSRVAVLHPTTRWERQQYKPGAAAVEGDADPQLAEAVATLGARARAAASPLIGSPDLPDDHPSLGVWRQELSRLIPGRSFALSARLLSESDRTYQLVVYERVPA